FFIFLIACNNPKSSDEPMDAAKSTEMAPVEFADAKYTDIGKAGIAALSSGDIAKWMESYADNAIYRWNNGDSLVGKPAIAEYWTKRRGEVIDSISFHDDIWLPVKVNTPVNAVQAPGVWLLGWYRTTAKYKNGKSMTQWIHTDFHFDANDKIDLVIQYLDRASINAALMPK
ncbi:MAG: nuclear transport factor 2 family protein, partial [Saprospiraceae bacterium]|nr:nuclear transport factor 2 family protein [Saprospiraceae bacterium]